jgi:hypothetical protein
LTPAELPPSKDLLVKIYSYLSANSAPHHEDSWQQIDMGGQLSAPTHDLGKSTRRLRQETELVPEPFWTLWRRKKKPLLLTRR